MLESRLIKSTKENFTAWMERMMDRFDMLEKQIERLSNVRNCLDDELLLDNQDLMMIPERCNDAEKMGRCPTSTKMGRTFTELPMCISLFERCCNVE